MTSPSRPPDEPSGIELLLELLNASEGLIDRNTPPPDVLDHHPEAASPTGPVPALAERNEKVEDVSVPAAPPPDDAREPVNIVDVEAQEDLADEPENRFAAHVVRGMSKLR